MGYCNIIILKGFTNKIKYCIFFMMWTVGKKYREHEGFWDQFGVKFG